MDCTLSETLACTACGRPGKQGRKQMCKAACGSTCLECGSLLMQKQRLPEGKWYWRCPVCRVDKRECVPCNRATLTDLASEQDAVD